MPKLEVNCRGRKRTIIFRGPRIVIGRQADNDVVIEDPVASRRHCVIEYDGDGFKLVDLQSHNGTWLRENKILEEVAISFGDSVRIGETFLLLLPDEAAAEPLPDTKGMILKKDATEDLPERASSDSPLEGPAPSTSAEQIRCAFCDDLIIANVAKRFRAELLCKECAAIASASQRSPKRESTIAERAAAIDTAAIAEKRFALGAALSILSAGGVLIGAILVGHFTKDTWERDNSEKLRMLVEEARRLDTGDEGARAALAKYEELVAWVGNRALRDAELRQIVETARDRQRSLESRFAAELAREQEDARRREQAEQERRQREAEERARVEQMRREEAARQERMRREEAERRAAAETLKRSAFLMSQEFVKKQLKAPSSARFPEFTSPDVTIVFDEQTRKYTVIAWVEAQNPFGVHLRSTYMCVLWPAGGDLWRSDLTSIGDP